MEDKDKENQVIRGVNLFEYIDKHCKEDITYRIKVWNNTYKKRINRYWKEPVDMGFEEDMDKATIRDKYYNFEL